jgi:hypothetical protein
MKKKIWQAAGPIQFLSRSPVIKVRKKRCSFVYNVAYDGERAKLKLNGRIYRQVKEYLKCADLRKPIFILRVDKKLILVNQPGQKLLLTNGSKKGIMILSEIK